MTTNELFGAWLYNKAPNIVIKVWSIKEVDYILHLKKLRSWKFVVSIPIMMRKQIKTIW